MEIQKLKLTHFWDPEAEPPTDDQGRFFSLKRSIDNGVDTPEIWAEYLVLSLKLGARGQARLAMRHLRSTQRGQRLLESLNAEGALAELKPKSGGASSPLERASSPPGRSAAAAPSQARRAPNTRSGRGAGRQPQSRQQQRTQKKAGRTQTSATPRRVREQDAPRRSARPAAATRRGARPAAATRKAAPEARYEPELEVQNEQGVPETVREEASDALQYLLLGSVPMKIVWFTCSFPAAIAIGQILLPANPGRVAYLGILPCLLVAAAVMHYARAILLTSADGAEEPPQMYSDMLAGSIKASFVGLVLLAACVGPGVLAISLGSPLAYSLPLLALGLLYMPMALLGVTVRRSFEAALPACVFRGMAAHSIDYIKIWGFTLLSAAVPLMALVLIGEVPLHMQVAVGGPLAIVPSLFFARLLGRFFYSRRMTLSKALGVRLRRTRKVVNTRARRREREPVDTGRRIDANPPNGRHRVAPGDATTQTVGTPAQMGNHTHTPLRRRQ